MKQWFFLLISLSTLISNSCWTQVTTVMDSLDNPIAITFVGDNIFAALHSSPTNGKIISFNVNDPRNTLQVHLDILTYPRALIEKDSILYIGLPSSIITLDLRKTIPFFETLLSPVAFPRAFAFDGNDLYFARENILAKIDITKPTDEAEFLTYFEESPLSIALNEDKLYIAAGNSIFRRDLETKRTTEIISNLEYKVYTLIIIDDFLYLDSGEIGSDLDDILVFNLKNLDLGNQTFYSDIPDVICLYEHNNKMYMSNLTPKFDGKPEGRILVIEKAFQLQPPRGTISLYPNPTMDVLHIKTLFKNDMSYELYDVAGKLIFRDVNIENIPMSNYPSGTYYLQFENKQQGISGVKKVIKL